MTANKTAAEIGSVYMKAISDGQGEIVRALKDSPIPIVSKEILEKMEDAQSRTQNPTDYANREAIKEARELLSLIWASIQKELNAPTSLEERITAQMAQKPEVKKGVVIELPPSLGQQQPEGTAA